MAERTFRLLASRAGAPAAVNGATQIRAGVMRPEIVIPIEKAGKEAVDRRIADRHETGSRRDGADHSRSVFRPDRQSGRLFPHELRMLDSGSKARVLEVAVDSQERIVVPRANVELIES